MNNHTHDIWVCLDCRYTLEGIESPDIRDTWDEICDRYPREQLINNESCSGEDCEDCGGECNAEDCECGWDSFSMQDCEGCGSRLAGYRFRYSVWGE